MVSVHRSCVGVGIKDRLPQGAGTAVVGVGHGERRRLDRHHAHDQAHTANKKILVKTLYDTASFIAS